MRKILLGVGIAALVVLPAAAQMSITHEATKVEPGTYAVEPYHTRVLFGVSHMGFTTYTGEFKAVSGTLQLDPQKPDTSSLDVKVSTDSVLVPNDKLEGELKSDQWLDAAKYPDITFKSTKVIKTGPDTAKVTGEFTLHGVTKPLTLSVKFNGAGTNPLDKKYTAGFEATGKISRSDFGVKTYVPLIGDEVDIKISSAFEKQG